MKTHRHMTNQEISQLLKEVSAAYEIKDENRFRISAYQNASASIEHLSAELRDVWQAKQLGEIPGVGPNIASHIDELFRTGQVKHFKQVFKGISPAVFTLLKIPGIGPKTADKLCRFLKIKQPGSALKRLEALAQKHKISQLEGFGSQTESEILKSLQSLKRRPGRMLLSEATQMAEPIITYLRQCPEVTQVIPLGSLRRQVATVGDLDLGVATENPKPVIGHLVKYPKIKKITDKGERKISLILTNNRQVDFRFQSSRSFGSLLQYFTGSKAHNIHLRTLALKKHLSLSEYGIKHKKKLFVFPTEAGFYQHLKLPLIPPELREDWGEIEAAQKKTLPNLVELKAIKGDLHVHDNIDIKTSHDLGLDSIQDLLKQAKNQNYQYLGLADHNPRQDLSPNKVISIIRARKDKIEEINSSSGKSMKIRVLNLLEIDIRPNGALALPEKAFDYLDFGLAAIHSSFTQDRKTVTQRVIQGLDHPKIKIFAHPTARLLEKREEIDLDWEKIFAFCLAKNKILEINAYPDRLDLPDYLVRQAVKHGVKLVINTDSHCREHLKLMPYGVSVARRGWAESKNIINTLSWPKFKTLLAL
jgi:DNA polymerase (family 10)